MPNMKISMNFSKINTWGYCDILNGICGTIIIILKDSQKLFPGCCLYFSVIIFKQTFEGDFSSDKKQNWQGKHKNTEYFIQLFSQVFHSKVYCKITHLASKFFLKKKQKKNLHIYCALPQSSIVKFKLYVYQTKTSISLTFYDGVHY